MSEMVAAGIVPHPDTAKRTMAKGSIGQVQDRNMIMSQLNEDLFPSLCHIYATGYGRYGGKGG